MGNWKASVPGYPTNVSLSLSGGKIVGSILGRQISDGTISNDGVLSFKWTDGKESGTGWLKVAPQDHSVANGYFLLDGRNEWGFTLGR